MNKEKLEKIIQSRLELLEDELIVGETDVIDANDLKDIEKEYKALQSLSDELLLTRDTDQFFANNYETIKSIIPDLPKDYEMSPLEKDVYVDDEGELRYSPEKVMAWYGVEPDTKQGGYSNSAKREFFIDGWNKMGMPKKAYANGKRTKESIDMMKDLTKYANEYAKEEAFGGVLGAITQFAFPRLYESAKRGKFDDASGVSDLYFSPEFAKDLGEQVLYSVSPTKVLGKSKTLSNIGKAVSERHPQLSNFGKSAVEVSGVPLVTTAWDMPGYDEEGNFSLTQNDFDFGKSGGGALVNFGTGGYLGRAYSKLTRNVDDVVGDVAQSAAGRTAKVATRTAKNDYAIASRDIEKLTQIKEKLDNNIHLTEEEYQFLQNFNADERYIGLYIDDETVANVINHPNILDGYIEHVKNFRDNQILGGSSAQKDYKNKEIDFTNAFGKNETPISDAERYKIMTQPQFHKDYDMSNFDKRITSINNSKVGNKVSDATDFMNTKNLITNEAGANSSTVAGGAVSAIPYANIFYENHKAERERKKIQREKALKTKKRKEASDKKSKDWRWKNGYATVDEQKTEEYKKWWNDNLNKMIGF